MGVFDGLPCTDADCAEFDDGDFATMVARSQRVAYGEDGVISAGSFVLTSAFPFEAQGVQAGHVIVLIDRASGVTSPARTTMNNDLLPITAVAANSVTLGRIGYAAGQGAFPGPTTGSTGVKFFVPSLVAQIRTASGDVHRALNIAADSGLIRPADLRTITILKVLRGVYFAQYRQANDDTYKSKRQDLDAQIAKEMALLSAIYAPEIAAETGASYGPKVGRMETDPCWRVPSNGGSELGWSGSGGW